MISMLILRAMGAEELRSILREELRLKTINRRLISTPLANTSYYLPETGWIDLSTYSHIGFLVYTPNGSPITLQIEASDGEDAGDLVGYAIPPDNYVVGAWNSIIAPEAAGLLMVRLRATTGPTAPTRLKMIAIARP